MKEIDVANFCNELQENLESFQEEMIIRNFSNRNQKEWFKLLGDYLGLLSNFEFDETIFDDNFQINVPKIPRMYFDAGDEKK